MSSLVFTIHNFGVPSFDPYPCLATFSLLNSVPLRLPSRLEDKQRDMLARMEGPDWPRLDWPLSNADARHVGDAEDIIHSGIDSLKARLAPKVP